MAAIKITALSPTTSLSAAYTFKDLHLDLKMGYSGPTNNQFFKNKEQQDLVADFDYIAIRTSIFNLFNTNPGERLLNPDFGLGLAEFLFLPVNKQNANLLGSSIQAGVAKWEPRVSVTNITIITDEDNNAYRVTLAVAITQLQNQPLVLPGILSNSGFQFIS